MTTPPEPQGGFHNPPGRWVGRPEVYDAAGAFLGFGSDHRHVQDLGGGRFSIDVTFEGPFQIGGHFFVEDYGAFRNYLGPANVGGADILAPTLIDSTSYWTALGMNQRFMLMVLPEEGVQLSLTLLKRGEILRYAVVGENVRVSGGAEAASLLQADPTPSPPPGSVYSEGTWVGQITHLDHQSGQMRRTEHVDMFAPAGDGLLELRSARRLSPRSASILFRTDGQTLWTLPDQPANGSASLWGDRAMSCTTISTVLDGTPPVQSWRREVIRRDGSSKAVVTVYTQRGAQVATAFGLMRRTD